MTLNIEKLTEDLQLEKTAEEHEMEKIAHVVNVVEQGQTLTAVGEEMFKIASELENEEFAALAQDTLDMGARFGACLTKTASEDGGALVEAVEIAEDLNKIASVYAEVADEVQHEDFSKLAEAVIGISNELTDEANEMFAEMEKEAGAGNVAKKAVNAVKDFGKKFTNKQNYKFTKTRYSGVKYDPIGGDALNDPSIKNIFTKEGLKGAKDPAIVYGTIAAALAGAGYGVKKATEKK